MPTNLLPKLTNDEYNLLMVCIGLGLHHTETNYNQVAEDSLTSLYDKVHNETIEINNFK